MAHLFRDDCFWHIADHFSRLAECRLSGVKAGSSTQPEFDTRLRELCHRLGASIGFDAVAGEMSARNFPGRLRLARQIQELLRSDLKTHFKTKIPLQEIGRALQQYAANMTTGEVSIMP
jgi:hypothetical protein